MTKQEEDFIEMISQMEQQDLVAMFKDMVAFGELPATTISQQLKNCHPDYKPKD